MTQNILSELIQEAKDEGYILEIALDLLTAYIDTRALQPYLGLRLLPRELRDENMYTESDLQFISVIADDGGRYSTSTKKEKSTSQTLYVSFGHYDLAVDITGPQIDKIIKIYNLQNRAAAMNYLLDLLRKLLRYAVDDKHELMAITALVDAKIKLVGQDKNNFVLNMLNPTGHRIDAKGDWSDDTYNPIIEDIIPALKFLIEKGFQINGIYSRTTVTDLLQGNEQVRKQVNRNVNITPNLTESLTIISQYINSQFSQNTIPPIMTYDRFYHTQTKTDYFMPADCMMITCTTPRNKTIAINEGQILYLDNLLGYFGLGTAQTQTQPGEIINAIVHDEKKPTYIEAEIYGCGAPVVQESERILIIKKIK